MMNFVLFIYQSFSLEEFLEPFNSEKSLNGWIQTKSAGYDGQFFYNNNSKSLSMATKSSRYAITKKFQTPINVVDSDFIIQYEVIPNEKIDCAGGYLKLYGDKNLNERQVSNKTDYKIMFGPDRCENSNLIHFIIKHKGTEKSLKIPPASNLANKSHVYSLVIRKNNEFEILIDGEKIRIGNLLTDLYPPVNEREIADPTDKKPLDWVDDEYIIDEKAVKPDDWNEDEPEYIPDPAKTKPPKGWLLNEPKTIPDPNLKKPEDWDDEVYGEWEPPHISNPKCERAPGCGPYEPPLILNEKYQGKWEPPRFRNPMYRGPWRPRLIPNPNFVEDLHPHNFGEIWAVGFELWTVTPSLSFRNIVISKNVEKVLNSIEKPKEKAKKQTVVEDKKLPSFNKDDLIRFGYEPSFFEEFYQSWIDFYQQDKGMAIGMFSTIVFTPILAYLFHRRFH